MIETDEQIYFDTEELEDIIIYYLELGDFNYADMAVNYALKLHPNSLDIKIKKLEVLLEWEEYTMAKEMIDELKSVSMENTDFMVCYAKYYSNLGNPKKSIEICKKALELGEELNFLNNFIGDEYMNLGDPFSALKHYQQALTHDPTDDYALENTMNCYAQLKKSEEAITFLNDYLDHFPFSESAWSEYGQYYFARRNYEEAIKAFDYILAINSGAVSFYASKAACLEAMKEYRKAIGIYEEMLELEYTKAFTFHKIGLCYNALKEPMTALGFFQKALREDPQYYMAMMEQSYIYEEMGSMEEALHFAKEAALLNDSSLDYQKRLAFLYVNARKLEESLVCLKRLVDGEPSQFVHWYAYVEMLMLVGEYEDAQEALEKAITIHDRAELYYQLSNCYHFLKQEKKSSETLAKAIEMDPELVKDMQEKYPHSDYEKRTGKEKSKKK